MFSIIIDDLYEYSWLCNVFHMKNIRSVMKQADIFSYENLTNELITLPPITSSVYKIHYEYNQEILGRRSLYPDKVPIAKFCSPLGWKVHNIEVGNIVFKLQKFLAMNKEINVPSSLDDKLILLSKEEKLTIDDWFDLCQYVYYFDKTMLIS